MRDVSGSDAFISYSHHADGDLAPALEAGLQGLAKPWNQRRAMEVFLDQQDLSASPHLWSSIVVALDASEWFVLLASPGSAGSTWVGQEITHWLSVPERRERLLVVLTAGTMKWADGDFTADSDAVHSALRGAFDEEPFFVDMSQLDRSITLDLRNPLFKERVATLAATIRRTTVGNLIGEDTRQYQRARRLRRIAVSALAVLTIGAIVASVLAFQQRTEAESQRSEAEAQRNAAVDAQAAAEAAQAEAEEAQARAEANAAEARARELAALAIDTMSDDPAVAALLAVEASYPNGAETAIDVVEAQTAVGVTLRSVRGATVRSAGARVSGTTIVASTDTAIATIDEAKGTFAADGSLATPDWWDAATGEAIDSPVSRAEELVMMAPIGKRIPFVDVLAPPEYGTVPVRWPVVLDDVNDVLYGIDLATSELIGQAASGDGTVTIRSAVLTGVELTQLVIGPSFDVFGLAKGGDVYRWSSSVSGGPSKLPMSRVRSLAATSDSLLAEVGQGVIDVSGRPFPMDQPADSIQEYMVQDQSYVSLGGLSDGEPTVAGSWAMSPNGQYLAAIAEGNGFEQAVLVWDRRTTRRLATITLSQPFQVMWTSDDRFAVASGRGVDQFRVIPRAPDLAVPADGVAMATDGSAVAVTAIDDRGAPLVVAGQISGADVAASRYQRRPYELVALDRHGAFVARSGYDDGFAMTTVLRVADGVEVARYEEAAAVRFAPDRDWLALGGFGTVDLIDMATWSVSERLGLPDGIDGVVDIRWSADGSHLLVLGYEFETNRVLWIDVEDGSSSLITSVDVSHIEIDPSGTVAAVGTSTGELLLFALDAASEPEPIASFAASSTAVTGLAFSPDGRRLVVSSQTTTSVWDVGDSTAVRRLQVLTSLPQWSFRSQTGAQQGGMTADAPGDGEWGHVAYRPDGRSFVMAGPSGMVEVPDFDPRLACELAEQRDLDAVAAILGEPSACTRVAALGGG